MSVEYIRKIVVQQGQVFLYSKSRNDDRPYHIWRCDSLTKVYQQEGQAGLDREVMRMLCEYVVLVGWHESLARYRHVLSSGEAEQIRQQYSAAVQAAFELLPAEDRKYPFTAQSEAAKQYRATERRLSDEKYTALAALCTAHDNGKQIGHSRARRQL